MRRGSLVGPIILILIGLLFLANNLRPDVPMLQFLGQYLALSPHRLGSGAAD